MESTYKPQTDRAKNVMANLQRTIHLKTLMADVQAKAADNIPEYKGRIIASTRVSGEMHLSFCGEVWPVWDIDKDALAVIVDAYPPSRNAEHRKYNEIDLASPFTYAIAIVERKQGVGRNFRRWQETSSRVIRWTTADGTQISAWLNPSVEHHAADGSKSIRYAHGHTVYFMPIECERSVEQWEAELLNILHTKP